MINYIITGALCFAAGAILDELFTNRVVGRIEKLEQELKDWLKSELQRIATRGL